MQDVIPDNIISERCITKGSIGYILSIPRVTGLEHTYTFSCTKHTQWLQRMTTDLRAATNGHTLLCQNGLEPAGGPGRRTYDNININRP